MYLVIIDSDRHVGHMGATLYFRCERRCVDATPSDEHEFITTITPNPNGA